MNKYKPSITIKDNLHVFRIEKGIKLIPPKELHRYRYFPDVYDTDHTIASISELPISMYFLDKHGCTVYMNEECARICGFATAQEAVGKSLADVSDEVTAAKLIFNSKIAAKANEIKIIDEVNHRKDGVKQQFLSIKAPWYGDDNQIFGSCGFSVVSGEHPLAESLALLSSLGMMNTSRKKEQTTQTLPATLTKRECECLELILKGYTSKQIAQVLGISYRTVEEYIGNIKQKMGVKTKAELLNL